MKDGFAAQCKLCHTKSSQPARIRNKDKRREQTKQHYHRNKEKYQKMARERYHRNKEKYREKNREKWRKYREKNIEKIKAHYNPEYHREYREKNREKIKDKQKIYCQNNKDKQNKQRRKKYKSDFNYRVKVMMRGRIRQALKNNHKSFTVEELIGCSIEELKQYLEKQFKPGMTWDNWAYDGWHLDHKIPCAAFDLSKPEEQFECFHYTNLQPLWAEENYNKRATIAVI